MHSSRRDASFFYKASEASSTSGRPAGNDLDSLAQYRLESLDDRAGAGRAVVQTVKVLIRSLEIECKVKADIRLQLHPFFIFFLPKKIKLIVMKTIWKHLC